MRDFRKLDVWDRSHQLTLDVATDSYPSNERFGLAAQMRRCAISIPSNIAEGAGRESRPDYARFLGVAIGSAHELDYQLQLSKDLGYLGVIRYGELASDVVAVHSMLASLRKKVLANGGISESRVLSRGSRVEGLES